MSSNSISLIYPGGSVSQEHVESMSNTALAVQQIVKAKGTARRSFADKDRFPVTDMSRQRERYYGQPVQSPDRTKMAKRFRVEVFEMPEYRIGSVVIHEAETWETEYETTWHSQFVEVGGLGMFGSQNQRKALKARRRERRLDGKRHRKATAKKDRPSQYDLKVVALHADFEPWNEGLPVHVHDRRFSMDWVDDIDQDRDGVRIDMDGYHLGLPKALSEIESIEDRVEAMYRHKANAEYDAKRRAEREAKAAKADAKRLADLDAKRRYWAGVYQRPEAERPALRPAEREIEERYYGSRRFLVANTRGANA